MKKNKLTRSKQVIRATVSLRDKEKLRKFCKKYGTKETVVIRMAVDMFMNKVKAKTEPKIIFLSPEAKQEVVQLVARSVYEGMAKGT